MKKILTIALPVWWLAACSSVTPNYDVRFGDAVRGALQTQTLNVNAPPNPDKAQSIDARAAVNTLGRYEDSFKAPPVTFDVINIGGAVSGH
jgi:hypothetical protein